MVIFIIMVLKDIFATTTKYINFVRKRWNSLFTEKEKSMNMNMKAT